MTNPDKPKSRNQKYFVEFIIVVRTCTHRAHQNIKASDFDITGFSYYSSVTLSDFTVTVLPHADETLIGSDTILFGSSINNPIYG